LIFSRYVAPKLVMMFKDLDLLISPLIILKYLRELSGSVVIKQHLLDLCKLLID